MTRAVRLPASRRIALALTALVLASATSCGGSDSSASPVSTSAAPSTSTTTVAPTTTKAPASTTSHKPKRTTTTLPELPVPIAPPPPGSIEPEVVVGTIEIPKIDVVKTLYSGITMPTLDRGPGHWPGSALPGDLGNAVVAGHRTSKDRPFERLDVLVPGDEIIYNTLGGRFVYRVTGTEIVDPMALWIVDQSYAKTTTLFACHPPGSVAYRIAVFATLEEPEST